MNRGFTLAPASDALLIRIKDGDAVSHAEWLEVPSLDERRYLEAEQAIVQERYTDIRDEQLQGCAPAVREMILVYRDLFINPHAARTRSVSLIGSADYDSFDPEWKARLLFWTADAHHLVGEVPRGQELLSQALAKLEDIGRFRAEALSVTALYEYLAGRNVSAANHHYRTRTELALHPDVFLSIYNSSMALRVFLKECDSIGFEIFSHELDQALSKKADRRYLLRQTGYRAMLMTVAGDREEALRLWDRADEIASQTSLALERGQYRILRGMVAALWAGEPAAQPHLDLAEQELAEAGFPGPYRAELECARVFVHWLGRHAKSGLERLLFSLREGRARVQSLKDLAPMGLVAHYQQAKLTLDHLIDSSPAHPPTGPSLVVSLTQSITRLGGAEEMAHSLSDFRLLPRFVRQLRNKTAEANGVVAAMQESVGLPVACVNGRIRIESQLDSHESRPDIALVTELAETLIKHLEWVADAARTRTLGELATQVAHDIRSPIAALKAARHSLVGDEASLISLAISRIEEIAGALLEAHRRPPTALSAFYPATALSELLTEKQAEHGSTPGLRMNLHGAVQVQGDVALFRRAVSNLINNAIEASPADSPIELELSQRDAFIEVVVRDQGSGFADHVLAGLRRGQHQTTKASGNGLGLKGALEFARSVGGEMEFRNRPQRGAEAVLRVPRAR